MDSQGGKRLKNPDIISNLPENIIEEMLCRLPIRDAVKTSVLSRNWRYKWTSVPDLVFSDTESAGTVHGHEDSVGKFIYRILNQHNGPVRKFCLFVTTTMISYHDIDGWINFLSRNGVRKFTLSFSASNSYAIHSSLFSCANLRKLNLKYFAIPSPPPAFKGFNHLTCLKLEEVTVSNDEGLRNLIAKCPNLVTLSMIFVYGLDGLNIDYAPKLEDLTFHGSPNYISLNNTPHLVQADIYFYGLPDIDENISLINNLNFLSNLVRLETELNFLKFLAQDHVRKLLPSTFKNLFDVYIIGMMFEDIDILSLILGLITSSPNLTNLIVDVEADPAVGEMLKLKAVAEYLEGESSSIGCFMNLRYVKMENIVGVGPEMELIKFILGKSPSLEQLKFTHDGKVPDYIKRESEALKELIRFPRASKIAKIILVN